MPKRRHNDKDDYKYITKKLKKLEKKLKRSRKRRHQSSSTSSESEEILSPNIEEGAFTEDEPSFVDEEYVNTEPTELETDLSLLPEPIQLPEPVAGPSGIQSSAESAQVPSTELDGVMLELLGEDPSVTKTQGKDINSDLAIRLQHIATEGLSKDIRKDLQNKYLQPSNCPLIDAPTLNPEIRAAVSEAVLKRDKGIELKQKQLGSAIACISEAITTLLQEENKNMNLIKNLMDAGRLLCDCQNADSTTRRNFVLYNLKKDIRDQLHKTKIDNFLFGKDLNETLKTAKCISKSGAELKLAPPAKIPTSKTRASVPQRNLNWKAPPPSRRQKGTQRREPTHRSLPANSSRPSYRAPPAPHPPPPPPQLGRSRR